MGREHDHYGFECPFCGTDYAPIVRSRISTAGWICFCFMLLTCVGTLLCWLPLVFLHEECRVCSSCGVKLDSY